MANDVGDPALYWIQCSDDETIAMEGKRLNKILDAMPTLRFLFFGHPGMQPKVLEQRDGASVLVIPDLLKVSKHDFIALTTAFFDVTSLPVPGSDGMEKLLRTITTLGGCDNLESRIREPFTLPTMPSEDVTELFHWQASADRPESCVAIMNQNGYSYCTSGVDPSDENNTIHYFRKRKSDTDL